MDLEITVDRGPMEARVAANSPVILGSFLLRVDRAASRSKSAMSCGQTVSLVSSLDPATAVGTQAWWWQMVRDLIYTKTGNMAHSAHAPSKMLPDYAKSL